MRILAIESSSKPASVAVCEDGELVSMLFQRSGLTHSRTLLPMAQDMLKNLEKTISDIDLIAVAHGPGSFTGIRIGISAALGLAWGADIPVIGVSTLEAMAYQTEAGGYTICSVLDARRGQIYNAKFARREGRLERLCPDRAISLETLALEASESNESLFLIGDGAGLCADFLAQKSIDFALAPAISRNQTAFGVSLAAQNSEVPPGRDVTPNYIRLSQAERILKGERD